MLLDSVNDNAPLVSLIVPAYNAADYLKGIIEDISSQTYQSIEVLFVDDGSQDGTVSILKQLASIDSRFRIITQAHMGVSAARNLGLRNCLGSFIGFLDADDRIDSTYVESLVGVLQLGVPLAVCGWDRGRASVPRIPRSDWQTDPTKSLLFDLGFFTSLWNKMFVREAIFADAGFVAFDESICIGEDEEWLSRVLPKCGSFRVVNEALYHWMVRDGSATSGAEFSSRALTEVDAKRIVYHLLSQNQLYSPMARQRYAGVMRSLLITGYEENREKPSHEYSSLLSECLSATERIRGGGMSIAKSRIVALAIKHGLPSKVIDWLALL